MPSLGLTGDTNMDGSTAAGDPTVPRKRHRGERIVWTPEEDEYLRKAVQIYGDKTEKWAKIAACVPGRTNKNCRKRWFHSLDPSLKKGGWTEEEDHLLRSGVQKFRGQWSKIAERIQGRTDDQCAKRWRESLDPDIDRAAWTPEDDLLLLQKFEEFGTQWQKIAALSFPGRPGLHCRNRWRKIQRSLNHMQRTNKRRRNQLGTKGASGTDAKTEGHSEHDEGAGQSPMRFSMRSASADDTTMQDTYLDDDYSMLEDNVDPSDSRNDSNPDEERPYGCAIPSCSFESSSPSLLFYHFKASHHGTTVLKPFRCTMPGCEDRKRYKNINGLQYHVNHAKNTPGHSGHSAQNEQGNAAARQEDELLAAVTASTSATTQSEKLATSTAESGAFDTFAPFVNSAGTSHSILPTPAQLQSLIPTSMPQPLVTHQAFNIPHTPESVEETAMTSSMSRGISLPQPHSTSLQCPELGCGQTFHSLTGLTSHMANKHGRQSIMMTNNQDVTVTNTSNYGSESITIPEDGYEEIEMDMDMEMDLAYLASEDASPMMASSNMLLMGGSHLHQHESLQVQLDRLARDHGALRLTDVHTPHVAASAQDLDILSMNELLFANHIANSLSSLDSISISSAFSNRIHFGTHINVSANDSMTLPSTPVTSANVSPKMAAAAVAPAAINIPVDLPSDLSALESHMGPISIATAAAPAKKFPCLLQKCPKSYGSTSAMRTHMKNEHPGAYTKPVRITKSSGGTGTATSPLQVMESKNKATAATLDFETYRSGFTAVPTSALPLSPDSSEGTVASPTSDSDYVGVSTKAKLKPIKALDDALSSSSSSSSFSSSSSSSSSSEKPFKCLVPACGKGYRNISGLKNHLLQAHGSTPTSKGAHW
ncbi:hypothetical protein EDD11_005508 [Mortierella claussenii]|nr:hypothetical protein EDD11_005508 [Mortierella claussenii]